MKGYKNYHWFECKSCGFKTYNEDDVTYCDNCNYPFCENCITFVEHQLFDESICKKCLKNN